MVNSSIVDSLIFWAFAVVGVSAALGAVLNRSIINAALCLIAVFLSIAGFFLLNNADFLAIAQVIIYAVGLTIIMLFAIMFTGDKPLPNPRRHPAAMAASGIIAFYAFALLIRAAFTGPLGTIQGFSPTMAQTLAAEGSTKQLGLLLFRALEGYALPFELASILLLAAMIGAIVIAKKRFAESDEQLPVGVRLPLDEASAPPEDVVEALRRKRLNAQNISETPEKPSDETVGAQ